MLQSKIEQQPNSESDTMSATRTIAQLALGYRYEDFPENVRAAATSAVLDHIALTVRGAREELTQILGQELFGKALKGEDLLPFGLSDGFLPKISMIRAASAHAIDFDDTLPPAMAAHTGGQVIGSLLAVASERKVSGKEFLTAVVAGFEVAARVGSLLTVEHYDKGFHPTGTVGCFGVAAACGRILRLSEDQMCQAFGIVATQASGIKCTFGTMAKPFNAGNSAHNGTLAARLAGAGFTAPADAIEADKGYLCLFMGKDPAEVEIADASDFAILKNAIKVHAACHATHPLIEAIGLLRDEHEIDLETVEKIEVETAEIGVRTASIGTPTTGLECKFSYSQMAASALAGYDTAADSTFTQEVIADPVVARLRDKVAIKVVDVKHAFIATVRITDADNGLIEQYYDMNESLLQKHDVMAEKVQAKFLTVLGQELGDSTAKRFLDYVNTLPESDDIRELG